MTCATHSGEHNSSQRSRFEHIMRGLPENQSGEGRHKCPYCAYERGLSEGHKRAIAVLEANDQSNK